MIRRVLHSVDNSVGNRWRTHNRNNGLLNIFFVRNRKNQWPGSWQHHQTAKQEPVDIRGHVTGKLLSPAHAHTDDPENHWPLLC